MISPVFPQTIYSPLTNLLSIPTTTHWLPNSFANWLISDGFSRAGEFIDILSAPAFRIFFASLRVLIPPATQKGMLISLAILFTQSSDTTSPLALAEIS